MSSTTSQTEAVATQRGGFVKLSGIIIAVIGAIMFVGGASTWVLIQNQLSAENIVVAEDASFLAGDNVNGPFSAYAQAQIINEHALDASGGKTYAELDREDPVAPLALPVSSPRAPHSPSALAFGVSAMAMGHGLVQVLGGLALPKLGRHEDL